MMKKMLILMLVLGLASMASATVTLELREENGTTPVADLDSVLVGSNYVLVVSGLAADVPNSSFGYGIYGPAWGAEDWDNLGPEDSTTTVLATGNMSNILWTSFHGYDMVVYDSAWPNNISSGDWFAIDLTGLAEGAFSLDLLDYNNSSAVMTTVAGTVIVPEPITIALLGLGGLFLRRRK